MIGCKPPEIAEIRGDAHQLHVLRVAVAGQRAGAVFHAADHLELLRARAKVEQLGDGGRAALHAARLVLLPDPSEGVGVFDGQRTNRERTGDAEEQRVGADGERQCRNGDGAVPGGLDGASCRLLQLVPDRGHLEAPSRLGPARLPAEPVRVDGRSHCLAPVIAPGGHAAACLQQMAELLLEIAEKKLACLLRHGGDDDPARKAGRQHLGA